MTNYTVKQHREKIRTPTSDWNRAGIERAQQSEWISQQTRATSFGVTFLAVQQLIKQGFGCYASGDNISREGGGSQIAI